jgi:hypothetical protein
MPQKNAGDRPPDNTGNFTVMMRIIEMLLLHGKFRAFLGT